MRRVVVAVPVAVLALAGVAAASGAFSSGSGSGAAPMQAPMPMPKGQPRVAARAVLDLHQPIVAVAIRNFAFVPAHVVVSPGTKIVWTNDDQDPHTVTTDAPGFSSQALDTGGRYAVALRRAGTYSYHCTIHPFMTASVVVQG
jgi:plastocyanin